MQTAHLHWKPEKGPKPYKNIQLISRFIPFTLSNQTSGKKGQTLTCFYNLCSSSSGNATYLGSPLSGILFDAGIGIRNFAKSLHWAGLPPSAVKAIFITHEHSDHVKGLSVISTRYRLPVYGSKGTISALLEQGRLLPEQEIHIVNDPIEVEGYLITPFHTSHDCKESLGFRVETPTHEQIGICTDLGVVDEKVQNALLGCDFVMLESNYDESMLMYGSYPFFLKRRIASEKGHLSNEQCAQAIGRLIEGNTRRFVLAHLSEQNNRPEVALAHSKNYLAQKEMRLGRDYLIDVLAKVNNGRMFEISC